MSEYFTLELVGNLAIDCIIKETVDEKFIIKCKDEYFLCSKRNLDTKDLDYYYLARRSNQYFIFSNYHTMLPTNKIDFFTRKDFLFITKVEEGDVLEMLIEVFGEDIERMEQ